MGLLNLGHTLGCGQLITNSLHGVLEAITSTNSPTITNVVISVTDKRHRAAEKGFYVANERIQSCGKECF